MRSAFASFAHSASAHYTRQAKTAPANKTGIAVLAAACVVLLLAYFATLAAVADDTIERHLIFSGDTPRVYLVMELWLSGRHDVWQTRWSTANYLLDVIIIFPLYIAFGYVAGGYIFPFVIAVIAIAGWIILCAAVFGKSHNRSAFVVIMHTLPFVYMAYFGGNVFHILLLPVYHTTAWVSVPWLLWLAARILQGGGKGYAIAFGAFSAFSVLSDPIILPWFFAPLFASLIMLYLTGKKTPEKKGQKQQKLSRHKTAFAAMTIGVIAGYAASKAVPFADRFYSGRVYSAPEFSHIINTIGNLSDALRLFASNNIIGAIVWIAFVIIALAQLKRLWFSPRTTADISIDKKLLLWFLPGSMAATAATIIATGLFPFVSLESFYAAGGFGGKRYVELAPPEKANAEIIRYMIPFIFIPLFAAWAAYIPAVKTPIIGGVLAVLAVAAIPKIADADYSKLDPYTHPFYDCMHNAAKRLNAKGAITSVDGREIFAYPKWRYDNFVSVGVARGQQGFLYMDETYRSHIKKAEFDFVVANAAGGIMSRTTPGRNNRTCEYDNWHQCIVPPHAAAVLDGQAIRGAFGEPAEVIQCPGNAAIYYYNPPIVLRDIRHGQRAGEFIDFGNWQKPADQ